MSSSDTTRNPTAGSATGTQNLGDHSAFDLAVGRQRKSGALLGNRRSREWTALTGRADGRDPVDEGHVHRDDIVRCVRRRFGMRGEGRTVEEQEEGEGEL